MDVLLGVSMDSAKIRMVLVEGENADGATVDEGNFHTDTPDPDNPATSGTGSQVLSAILGTREGAAEGGYALASTGVVWSDPTEAAALRDALAAHKVENVMLVSAFVAAAALAQAVGHETGCGRIAMLLVEPDSATLGVVDSDDGSVTVVSTELLDFSRLAGELAAGLDADTVAHLADMVTSCDTVQTRPESLFAVGHGIDIARLKPALEAMTPLSVSTPGDPETALARGAALASAKAPLFTSTTAALAYSQDPGTDRVDRYLIIPDVSDVGSEPVAYSLVLDPDTVTESDNETGAHTEIVLNSAFDGGPDKPRRPRSPLLLVGSTLAAVIVIALVALELALAVNIRTTVALQPRPQQNLIVPTETPAPAQTVRAAIPAAQHAPSVPNRVVAAPAIPAPAAPVPAARPAIPAPAAPVPAAVPAPLPAPADPLPVLFPFPAVGAVPAPPPPVVAPPVSAEFFPNLLLTATPPAQVPAPAAAVQVPAPAAAVQVPAPAAAVQVPLPAAPKAPAPQVQLPKPQMPLPAAPKAPVQLPAPQVQVPKPPMPAAPAPALQLPALQLPLPKAPTAPGAPAAPAARP